MTGQDLRALLAEALGTLILVATVVGSGLMAAALADGNDGIALLGNTLATGAMLAVLIAILGPVSGASFNPAVSLEALAFGGARPLLSLASIAAQFGGGVLGTMLAHAMFDLPLIQAGSTIRAGFAILLSEGVATFMLILTILGAMRYRPHDVPWLVALAIVAGYWFTASTSFANPAVTLGRALSDSFAGIRPVDAPAFILVQIGSALIAGAFGRWLFGAPAARMG